MNMINWKVSFQKSIESDASEITEVMLEALRMVTKLMNYVLTGREVLPMIYAEIDYIVENLFKDTPNKGKTNDYQVVDIKDFSTEIEKGIQYLNQLFRELNVDLEMHVQAEPIVGIDTHEFKLWWAGKYLQPGTPLSAYFGNHDELVVTPKMTFGPFNKTLEEIESDMATQEYIVPNYACVEDPIVCLDLEQLI